MQDTLPNWLVKTLGILLIIFLALLIVNQINALKGTPQTMRVVGEGKVKAVPDVAMVNIGVTSEGVNAVEVKDKNNQKINQVIAYIKQQGIDAKDIQTSNVFASPKYNYANGQNTIVGYQANQTIIVKFTGINKSKETLEKTLAGVINNGANEIQGITFSFDDPNQLKEDARAKAIDQAKQNAKAITSEAGLSLGKLVNVGVSNEFVGVSYANVPGTMRGAVAAQVTPNIEPGNQEVMERVELVYEVY